MAVILPALGGIARRQHLAEQRGARTACDQQKDGGYWCGHTWFSNRFDWVAGSGDFIA
ncbi:MAG: hypothetical protein OXC05_07465 [Halieaceae bacterium]|nr:hypothetical protein [Halieaceae bacterium]